MPAQGPLFQTNSGSSLTLSGLQIAVEPPATVKGRAGPPDRRGGEPDPGELHHLVQPPGPGQRRRAGPGEQHERHRLPVPGLRPAGHPQHLPRRQGQAPPVHAGLYPGRGQRAPLGGEDPLRGVAGRDGLSPDPGPLHRRGRGREPLRRRGEPQRRPVRVPGQADRGPGRRPVALAPLPRGVPQGDEAGRARATATTCASRTGSSSPRRGWTACPTARPTRTPGKRSRGSRRRTSRPSRPSGPAPARRQPGSPTRRTSSSPVKMRRSGPTRSRSVLGSHSRLRGRNPPSAEPGQPPSADRAVRHAITPRSG